jgi:hypothetical protein
VPIDGGGNGEELGGDADDTANGKSDIDSDEPGSKKNKLSAKFFDDSNKGKPRYIVQ